jgi:hypothetical protein
MRLFEHNPMAELMHMPRSRHFPFLDEPTIFNEGLLHFLQQPPIKHTVSPREATPRPPLPPVFSASLAAPLLNERPAPAEH